MLTTFYKVTNLDGTPCHGGSGQWHLPHGKRPGKWMPKIAEIEPCVSGYHVCTAEQLLSWIGPVIWTVEIRGESIYTGDKIIAQQARLLAPTAWNREAALRFAVDCAEHVMPICREWHQGPDEPWMDMHAAVNETDPDVRAARAAEAAEAARAARAARAAEAARAAWAAWATWAGEAAEAAVAAVAAWAAWAAEATWAAVAAQAAMASRAAEAAWAAVAAQAAMASRAAEAAWAATAVLAASASRAGEAARAAMASRAGEAARAAEREWQAKRLQTYLTVPS